MKTWQLILIISILAYSCESDSDMKSSDGKNDIEEFIYSSDSGIIYESAQAEVAFRDQGKLIGLTNGMFVKQINDSSYIFDSDMLLTIEQVKELELYNEINYEPKSQTKGTVSKSANTWPNNTVYYSLNSNVSSHFRTEILAAIEQWRSQSKLYFRERTNQKDYIEFILGNDGSYSKVGRIGGRQYINLDSTWANRGTAMHEIGHAVGLVHEHQCWIFHDLTNSQLIFKWDNIKSSSKSNYQKYNDPHIGYTDSLYDPNYPINSLMIYGSFSSDNAINSSKPVMTYNRFGGVGLESTFTAQRSYLSVSDRIAVAKKYGYSYNPATDPNRPPI